MELFLLKIKAVADEGGDVSKIMTCGFIYCRQELGIGCERFDDDD